MCFMSKQRRKTRNKTIQHESNSDKNWYPITRNSQTQNDVPPKRHRFKENEATNKTQPMLDRKIRNKAEKQQKHQKNIKS